MPRFGPKSIRGRVTLMASIATAFAMALVVVVMGLGTRAILEDAVADSLRERLDQARDAVSVGDYDLVTDLAGNEVIQVIDADGEVVAGSRNVRGLSAITGDAGEGELEVGELEFQRESNAGEGPVEPVDVLPVPTTAPKSNPSTGATSTDDADDGGQTSGGDNEGDDADDADDTDDGEDADDGDNDKGGDDDDGGKGSGDDDDEKPAKSAKGGASGKAKASFQLDCPLFSHGVAWADDAPAENSSPSEATIDAAAILGSEGPYLILREQVASPDGPMTIVAVTSLSGAARSAQQMIWLLMAVMAGVLVAVVALTWALAGRTLRPVEQMRVKAASITAENLSERIDVPAGDKDLAPLAKTLNEMLARVERSFEEEKRFISDASHELKSPIAATSVILDSLREHPEGADIPQAIEDLSNENTRMASVVGDMLALTRYDEGRLNCKLELADMMDVILEETFSLKARCDVEVDVSDIQPLVCRVDVGLLRHALRNLFDNAARYATSVVKVSCVQGQDDSVVVLVSDDGCGIAPEDRKRAFGRFVCLDERSGTGLGLAVVETIAAAHGGSVAFIDPELDGATAQLMLPGPRAK